MPKTLDLLIYVSLGGGGSMLVCACLVYVITKVANRGTLVFASIGALLICAGIIANLKISWDDKGGTIELETTKALTDGLTGAANAVTDLQETQAASAARLQSQLDTIEKRQDALDKKIDTVAQKQGVPEPLPEPPIQDPACSPDALKRLDDREAELKTKKTRLAMDIEEAKGGKLSAEYEKTKWDDLAVGWGYAKSANIDVLRTQLQGVDLSIELIASTREHCGLSTKIDRAKPQE